MLIRFSAKVVTEACGLQPQKTMYTSDLPSQLMRSRGRLIVS